MVLYCYELVCWLRKVVRVVGAFHIWLIFVGLATSGVLLGARWVPFEHRPSFPLSWVGGRHIRGTTSSLPSSPRQAAVYCLFCANRWMFLACKTVASSGDGPWHPGLERDLEIIITIALASFSHYMPMPKLTLFKLISWLKFAFSSLLNYLDSHYMCR